MEGYHIRANDELVNDLGRIYDQKDMIAILWYLFVNEDGRISIEHAKFPSQIKESEKQINSMTD